MSDFLFIRIESDQNIEIQEVSWVLASSFGKLDKIQKSPTEKTFISEILDYKKHSTKLVLIIPDRWLSYYLVDMPIKEYKKQMQAVPYILEEKLISDVDSLHFSIGPQVSSGQYLVSAISKAKIKSLIDSFLEHYKTQPDFILTDSICLYNNVTNNNQDSYNIYLNGQNNQALILNKKILVTDINNISIILDQISNDKININLYKHNISGINSLFEDEHNIANIKSDINILSEQNIDLWLPFLVQSWLANNKTNKQKFNLAKGLIQQSSLDIKFNNNWRYVANVLVLCCVLFYGYKYYDNKIYTQRQAELSSAIKSELAKVGIVNTNLKLAQKQLDKINIDLERDIISGRQKDEFFILLSAFAENYKSELDVTNLYFKDNILELSFLLSKNHLNLLDNIKQKIQKQDITIKDISNLRKEMDYSKKIESNNTAITWQLTLNEKISLNI